MRHITCFAPPVISIGVKNISQVTVIIINYLSPISLVMSHHGVVVLAAQKAAPGTMLVPEIVVNTDLL